MHLTKRKRVILGHYKKLMGCIECGYNEHFAALQFAHREGTNKRSTNSSAYSPSWGWEKILHELLKCDVKCGNCHAVETYIAQKAERNKK